MGAQTYTQGNNVHFAPGQYSPGSQKGQELLGHELTHVVQQRQGRVQPTKQGKGMTVNDSPALEHEADVMGAKAAQGKRNSNMSEYNTNYEHTLMLKEKPSSDIDWTKVIQEANTVKGILNKVYNKEELTTKDKHNLIFSIAEISYELSKSGGTWIEENPDKVEFINNWVIAPLRELSSQNIDINPNVSSWNDLIVMFVLELGNETANITDLNSPTLMDLRSHEGVNEAREKADELGQKLQPGENDKLVHVWNYQYNDMIDNLREMKEAAKTMDQSKINMLTLFLGTYAITVHVRKTSGGTIEKQFTVKNTSGMESLTRFRREAQTGNGNQGILENKQRGDGFHLCGNFNQIWQWSE